MPRGDGTGPAGPAIVSAFEPLLDFSGQSHAGTAQFSALQNRNKINMETKRKMRIAIPITDGRLSAHFGHCEEFALVDVDEQTREIANIAKLQPPAHEPGALPKWLSEQKTDVIIAGGMGQRAQQLFSSNNIKVIVGASDQSAEELASAYLNNRLETGNNICDH